MSQTIRFGVSLPEELLASFDALCRSQGYENRSEAIRDLIRQALVEKEWSAPQNQVAATLTLVYDHHKSDLAQHMTELQHSSHHLIITALHVHLDHNNCLEVLVLKGTGSEVRDLARKLISTKGVLHGKLCLTTTGENLT